MTSSLFGGCRRAVHSVNSHALEISLLPLGLNVSNGLALYELGTVYTGEEQQENSHRRRACAKERCPCNIFLRIAWPFHMDLHGCSVAFSNVRLLFLKVVVI